MKLHEPASQQVPVASPGAASDNTGRDEIMLTEMSKTREIGRLVDNIERGTSLSHQDRRTKESAPLCKFNVYDASAFTPAMVVFQLAT